MIDHWRLNYCPRNALTTDDTPRSGATYPNVTMLDVPLCKTARATGLQFVGTSFRRVGFERLGRYVLPPERAEELARLRDACGARELVYVATCNRVECYLLGEPAVGSDRAAELCAAVATFFGGSAEDLFALEGDAALEHLFGVVASLDSLVLGECEIAGQVRRAAEAAALSGLAGAGLRRIFEQATRVARRVRAETAIGRTPVSVASLVLRRVREHFPGGAPRRAALGGVGEMTRKIAPALGSAGATKLLFVNRTEAKAAELAARHGGTAMSLERFRAAPPDDLDLVVTATRAPGAVIDLGVLGPSLARCGAGARALVCDLGVPADVSPEVAAHPRVTLVRLHDLEATAQENRARLSGEVEHVKAIVSDEVRRSSSEKRLRSLAQDSAEKLLAGRLAHLAPEDRETVRRFATQLAERIARQP